MHISRLLRAQHGAVFSHATTKERAIHNGRKTNMNRRQRRPAPFAAAQRRGHRMLLAPNRTGLTTREETMNGISLSPELRPKAATQSQQKTTTSMPNIISDRCPRTEERHKRLRCNDCNGLVLGFSSCRPEEIVSVGPPPAKLDAEADERAVSYRRARSYCKW